MTGRGNKTPLAIAESTGRTSVNPERYEDREDPEVKPLGLPVQGLNEKDFPWYMHALEHAGSWLCESDRAMLTLYAKYAAIIHDHAVNPQYDDRGFPELPLNNNQFLQFEKICRALGFTPTTRQNVQLQRGAKRRGDDLI